MCGARHLNGDPAEGIVSRFLGVFFLEYVRDDGDDCDDDDDVIEENRHTYSHTPTVVAVPGRMVI